MIKLTIFLEDISPEIPLTEEEIRNEIVLTLQMNLGYCVKGILLEKDGAAKTN